MNSITRSFEIDAGHRLMNHESKCRNVHGHRYRFEVTIQAEELDANGRVLDFGVFKEAIGGWLDQQFDHGFIVQDGDPLIPHLQELGMKTTVLDCPPSIENLVKVVFDESTRMLAILGMEVTHVRGFETPNCWADYSGDVRVRVRKEHAPAQG